jgi:Tfp pilus assembly protein PilF
VGTLAALVCLAGCAARRTHALTDRFVAGSGEPIEVDVQGLDSGERPVQRADGDPRATGPVEKASDTPTAEAEYGSLAAALEVVGQTRTVESLLALAEEYRRLGIVDEAFDRTREALRIDPHDGRARDLLARIWRDWGVVEHGLPEAYRAVADAPNLAAAQNTLGTLLFMAGAVEAARERFERALSLDPRAAYAWSNLCYVSLMSGDAGRAGDECERAVALDSELTAARHNLALVRAAQGRLAEAEQEFNATGDRAVAWYNMGIVHLAAHRYDAAAEAFEAAYRERPELGAAFERAFDARRRAAAAATGSPVRK